MEVRLGIGPKLEPWTREMDNHIVWVRPARAGHRFSHPKGRMGCWEHDREQREKRF